MNIQRTIGVILIIAGILGFVFGSVSVTTTEEVMDVGPVEVEKQEERTLPLGPIASGITLVVGVGLVGFSFRKSTESAHG